jgi:fructose-1,6-bisphosphatase/inositol monophosphatase family enzyme
VFSLVHLLLGDYISYVANLKIWDLAAGVVLMEKLGFVARFQDGRPFTTSIDEENYKLRQEEGPNRWKARGRIIFAGSEEALDYTSRAFA